MQQSFVQRLGSVARFIGSLVLTAAIGLLAWFFYQQYLDQQAYNQISETGKRVTVLATDVSRDQRTWTDAFTNAVYISFSYQDRPYTLRYKQDSGWLSAGDRIALYYHPGLDAFRQPKAYTSFQNDTRKSRLIGYTFLHQWNSERKWLVATIALGAIFLLLLCGIITTLTNFGIFRTLGQLVFVALLLTGTSYLIYNTWRYYQYYNQVKTGSNEVTVQVLGTGKHAISRRSSWLYTYEATVLHHQQERVIPIEETEYDRLKNGDPLQVRYNPALNEMMSLNYTPDHTNLLASAFALLLLTIFGWQQVKNIRNRRTI